MKHNTLRKAAILVSSLDTHSADALLDEMPAEDAARVRNAILELGDVDPREQQQIMKEFVRHNPQRAAASTSGVELDPSLLAKLHESSLTTANAKPTSDSSVPPFTFLAQIEAEELARVLVREHPQTAAIVISHLSPSRAADVLRRFPAGLQSVTLIRIARLESLAPEVIRDIEHEMQSWFATRSQRQEPVQEQGVATIRAILDAASSTERQHLLADLARQDRSLAQHFGTASDSPPPPHPMEVGSAWSGSPDTQATGGEYDVWNSLDFPITPVEEPETLRRPLIFADLEKLDDAALAHILRVSSPQTALLALAGASHDFVQRIRRQLSPREAAMFERRLRQLGPIRLDDIERAQLRLADIAQQLIDAGEIATPPIERFAVAA